MAIRFGANFSTFERIKIRTEPSAPPKAAMTWSKPTGNIGTFPSDDLFFIFYNNAPVSMTAGVIGFVSQDAKTWEPVLAADFPNMTTGIHTFGGIGQD